ncbi:MAG: hypothetical protein JXR69_06170 [Candidatus Delongbacteria bacterium]|nr:hypothetical protein [Candidatus Delongbacteria bacterium]
MKNKEYRLLTLLLILLLKIFLYTQDSLYLSLPDEIYLSSDIQFSIYFNNLISGILPDKYSFEVSCNVGYRDSIRYNLDSLNEGSYEIEIHIKDSLGQITECDSSMVFVSDHTIDPNDTLKVLVIGDSYTNAGVYLKHLKDIYNSSTNNPIKFMGTNYNVGYPYYGIDNELFHEGYWGKTWDWFANNLSSPFIFEEEEGLDISRYFYESLDKETPDIIIIFLGINDLAYADPTTVETIDNWIDYKILNDSTSGKLIDSICAVFPNSQIGIALTPPVNVREYTYTDTTQLDYFERKKCHHRLCQRYIDYFKTRNNSNISIIPINVNIDTFSGFGETDPLHPVISGYRQIAFTIYGWIKYNIQLIKTRPAGLEISFQESQVDLNWDNVEGAELFRIYRSINPFGDFIKIGTSLTPNYIDHDISLSKKYFYRVTSENSLK